MAPTSGYGPDLVPLPAAAIQVALTAWGNGTACALLTGGDVYCWGDDEADSTGSSGDAGSYLGPILPTLVAGPTNVTKISANTLAQMALAVTSNGNVWVWGAQQGNTGTGVLNNNRSTPPSLMNFVSTP